MLEDAHRAPRTEIEAASGLLDSLRGVCRAGRDASDRQLLGMIAKISSAGVPGAPIDREAAVRLRSSLDFARDHDPALRDEGRPSACRRGPGLPASAAGPR